MKNAVGNQPDRRERLERLSSPVAILHDGMYVYANPAYLALFGYHSVAELQGIPVLDMLEADDHALFAKHMAEAAVTPFDAAILPAAELTFIGHDNSPHHVTASSHGYRLDDEACVEMWLRTEDHHAPAETLSSTPWRYYASIFLLLLFSLAPLALLPSLDIDNAPSVYFPKDEPAVIHDDRLRKHFPSDQVYILLFEGPSLYSDEFLTTYHQVVSKLETHALVKKVFSITTQSHISGTEDEFIVAPLIDVKKLQDSTNAERQQRVIQDRFAKNTLVAADGSAVSMTITPVNLSGSLQRLQLEEDILTAVSEAGLNDYLSGRTGFIPLDIAELRSMLRDNMIFIPATLIIGLSLTWWLFRRWLAVILAGLVIGAVVNSSVSLFVLFAEPFTLISSILPPLLSALTIAALVHFFNAMNYAARRGRNGKARVAYALHEIHRPVLFTSLTTAAGLLSLLSSPIPAIQSFGLFSAIGVLMIYIVVIHILPTLFIFWDRKPWPSNSAGLGLLDNVVKRLSHLGMRHPAWVIILTLSVIGAGIPSLWKVEVETSFHEFFLPDHPVRRDTALFENSLSGTGSLEVIFETANSGELKQPGYLAFMRTFQIWVEQLPGVDRSVSPADFIEEMHWGYNAEKPEFRRIPDNSNLISQYLLIYDGDDLYDFIDEDFQTSHISLSLNIHTTSSISATMEEIRTWLTQHTPDGLAWEIAGYSRMIADMEDLLVTGQVYSLWGALGLVFLLMLFLTRSLGSALLCMIPNISPILLIFIIMGLSGMWLDVATAMIASVAVGIAVDDTIHIYHCYIARLQAGASPVQALARTYRQAGRAVMITTIILSAQFMILITSLFQPTAHFGMLTSIGLWTALLFDLLLLPAMLIVLANFRSKRRDSEPLNTPNTGK